MKRIIIKLSMFTQTQKFFLEDNGKVSEHTVPMNELSKTIVTYNPDEVLLYGSPIYTKRVEKEVKSKFNNSDIVWKYNNKEYLKTVKEHRKNG